MLSRRALGFGAALAAAALLLPCTARGEQYVVGTQHSVSFPGYGPPGESQSAVVAPGVNSACPKGRVLVTDDQAMPSSTAPVIGSVRGRDLSNPDGPDIVATVNPIPTHQSDYGYGTNDHDIAVLSDGTVILEWGGYFKGALRPKPSWFDATVRPGFGPGARRGLMVWRSTDCGATFNYVAQIDPAHIGDGSCAFPQYVNGNTLWNGGADGQLMRVDPRTDALYVTFGCAGAYPNVSGPRTPFSLSDKKVSLTFVFRSTDRGTSWQPIGSVPQDFWRLPVTALDNGSLAFGEYAELLFGHPIGVTGYAIDSSAIPTPGAYGWGSPSAPAFPRDRVQANVLAAPIVARTPSSDNVLLLYPSIIDPGSPHATNGYRMYFYDRAAKTYAEALQIQPLSRAATSAVMHLAAIDLGRGPMLLYWYDVDGAANRATMRARIVFGAGQYSQDFSIERVAPASRFPAKPYFNLGAPNNGHWYGDYITAGGYPERVTRVNGTFHFFPQWCEPDGTEKFVSVDVFVDTGRPPIRRGEGAVRQPKPRPAAAAARVDLKTRRFTPAELNARETEGAPRKRH